MGAITKETKHSLAWYARDESIGVGVAVRESVGVAVAVGCMEPSSSIGGADGDDVLALVAVMIPQVSGSAVPGELTYISKTVLRTPSCAVSTDTI